jgi:threonine/homoserine/homoserine lactone efflux protein
MVLTEDPSAFIIAGVALAGSPGPATLSLAAASAGFGIRKSLALAAGCTIGVFAVMLLTASGLTGLVLAEPVLGTIVKALAAAYMLYLAWRIATAPPVQEPADTVGSPSFFAGTMLGLGNPKAYAAMAALFSGFVLSKGHPAAEIVLKCVILVIVVVTVNAAWLLLGTALTRLFRDPVANRALCIGFAVLLVASVLIAFLH